MEAITYFDYAATTPVDDRVIAAMRPYFAESFGNPSSVHRHGQRAEAAVESARESVARILRCSPSEILFTSCGTESDNLALRGAVWASPSLAGDRWILTSRTEHHAVSKTARQLERLHACEVHWLQPDMHGVTSPETLRNALGPGCTVASLMYANNEIGTINPIDRLAAECRAAGVLFHTDAVQAAAYLSLDVNVLGIDLMSLGGHKFYGPKGVGALYVRKGTPLMPSQTGGQQESGARAGTHNVPLIVGFARALELAQEERQERTAHVIPLRDHILTSISQNIPDCRLTGNPSARLPNHASFAFMGVDGNLLLGLLDAAGFACSSGSACKTGSPEPSDVLMAIGLSPDWALGSLRVTLGKDTDPGSVEAFVNVLPGLVEKARALSRAAQ